MSIWSRAAGRLGAKAGRAAARPGPRREAPASPERLADLTEARDLARRLIEQDLDRAALHAELTLLYASLERFLAREAGAEDEDARLFDDEPEPTADEEWPFD